MYFILLSHLIDFIFEQLLLFGESLSHFTQEVLHDFVGADLRHLDDGTEKTFEDHHFGFDMLFVEGTEVCLFRNGGIGNPG